MSNYSRFDDPSGIAHFDMSNFDFPLPFEAYLGPQPFMFVSYAHKDGQIVFPILASQHSAGYRIWYDEGIDPGNEWPDEK